MSTSTPKPKFRGNWAPSVHSPVPPNFSQPTTPTRKTTQESPDLSPDISLDPEPKIEPVPETEPEPEPELEPEPEPKIEAEPAKKEPVENHSPIVEQEKKDTPRVSLANKRHTVGRAKAAKPKVNFRPIHTSTQHVKNPEVEKKLKEYAQEQIMNDVIEHLSAERLEIHERELARELNRFKEATNDRTLQRQLDTIQFHISSQLERQRKEELEELARQQERERRRAMLQRMINDLQSELNSELEAEKSFQARRKQQREETIEEFKKWDTEIQTVRDRISRSRQESDRERVKEERADSEKVGKVQKLYYDALHHKDPNAAKKITAVSTAPTASYTPIKSHRRGKPTNTPGSDAMRRLLDRLQGLESDSDSDDE